MQDAVRQFETEMTAVLVEQWRGCSWQVAELGARSRVPAVFCGQVDDTVWWQARRSRRVCRPRVSRRARRRETTWSPSPSAEVTSRSCARVCYVEIYYHVPTIAQVMMCASLSTDMRSGIFHTYARHTRRLDHKVSVREKSVYVSPVVVVVWVLDVRPRLTV